MYLVELRPGKEELYRTADDLALAIRDGNVDARSRIYHRSTAKWISITLHPQYKAIVAGQNDEPLARVARKGWGLLSASLGGQAADPTSDEEATDGVPALEGWKRPLGLGLSALLLVLGVQLAFSGPRPPWAGRNKTPVVWTDSRDRAETAQTTESADELPAAGREETDVTSLMEREGSELVSLASTSALRPLTPELVSDTATSPVMVKRSRLPSAPRLGSTALQAALASEGTTEVVEASLVEGLLARYEAASDSVRARLETGMRAARLTRIFSPSRLTPGGGVRDTRLSLAGAVNFIRVFRQRQAAIDQTYRDSVTQLARRRELTQKEVRQWNSRPKRRDTPALELLSGSLIATIDSMLGVLDGQAGAYKLRGTAIAFEDPTAGQAYGDLRRRIEEQINSAVAAGGATSPGPTSLLLQAIGTSTLPRET
jgi:hypothetical protein